MEPVTCIIETPKGCGAKYNFDPKLNCYQLSKVLPAGLVFPFDFGYIPGTKGADGDPLDVLVVSEVPAFQGCAMKCRIIGAIEAEQKERDGSIMRNDRYIAVADVSVLFQEVQKIRHLPPQVIKEIECFFINYNEQAGKTFKPLKWVKADKAIKAIQAAQSNPEPTKLVQILLPLYNAAHVPFPESYYATIRKVLMEQFGGVTAYTQSPASGLWKDESKEVTKDKLIIYEVMVSEIDVPFWKKYKAQLEEQFSQKEIVIRRSEIGLL